MTRTRRPGWVIFFLFAVQVVGCRPSPEENLAAPTPPSASATGATVEPPFVTVTPKAADMVRQVSAEVGNGAKMYLRVRVVPGGCQGYMHKLDLDAGTTAADDVCESSGVAIVADRRQREMLLGSRVDFAEENGQTGFKIDNPNFNGGGAGKWLAVLEGQKDLK